MVLSFMCKLFDAYKGYAFLSTVIYTVNSNKNRPTNT